MEKKKVSSINDVDLTVALYKAQVQVDQGPPHKTRDTESYRV